MKKFTAKRPCHTPGCSGNCAYAYSCHNARVGRPTTMFWPLFGLALLFTVGVVF